MTCAVSIQIKKSFIVEDECRKTSDRVEGMIGPVYLGVIDKPQTSVWHKKEVHG